MTSHAFNTTVCGLALLLSGLTIIGSTAYLQREHDEQDTSWLLGRLHITLPKEG
jgi:hypothetical protein